MNIKEQITYWINLAEDDIPVMENLFTLGHFHWSLFVGHLILEKYLKAIYVRDNLQTPPKTHNLVFLAKSTKLKLTAVQEEYLLIVNTFNIEARYTDYKNTFYKKCTKVFANNNILKIKEFLQWLKSQMK